MMHSCHLPDCPDVHHLSLIVAHLCLIGSAPPSCIKAVLPLGASGFACAYAAVGGDETKMQGYEKSSQKRCLRKQKC